MIYVNLTGYFLEVEDVDGILHTFRGQDARASVVHGTEVIGRSVDGLRLMAQTSTVRELPAPEDGVVYIVLEEVYRSLPERLDLVAPAGLTNQRLLRAFRTRTMKARGLFARASVAERERVVPLGQVVLAKRAEARPDAVEPPNPAPAPKAVPAKPAVPATASSVVPLTAVPRSPVAH